MQAIIFFGHGFKAFGADRSPLAADGFNLKVKVLPLNSFDVGVGPGGAFSRTSPANFAFFRHKILPINFLYFDDIRF